MKSKIIKRFAGVLVFLMLSIQIFVPGFAQDETNLNEISAEPTLYSILNDEDVGADTGLDEEEMSETPVYLSENVDASNVVGVLSADITDTNMTDAGLLIDQAVDEVLLSLQDDVVKALEDVRKNIEDKIADINMEIKNNPQLEEKLLKKIIHLKELLAKLRAKAIFKNQNLVNQFVMAKNTPKLYEIRWGNLTAKRQRCVGVSLKDLRDSLLEGKIPVKCDNADEVLYMGVISVNKGELNVRKEILFEDGDKVTDPSGTLISFTSSIATHWDGIIVEYTPPVKDSDPKEPVKITIQLGELDQTYSGNEILGRKKIGNDHMLEVLPLGAFAPGLAKATQNKLVQNQLKIQERVNIVRDRLDRIRALKQTGVGADELEEVIDEAGGYNFGDALHDEVESAMNDIVKNITIDTTAADLDALAERFKNKIASLKTKALNLKFDEKIIPFKDTDDDQWYTDYVASVKSRGIISGYKDPAGNELGEFRPGNNVTVAEILKIGLETSGKGRSKGTPMLMAALNHWAKEYVAKAEELGLNLINDGTSLDRPATRSEVIRMMLESLGIIPDAVSSTDFSDVHADGPEDKGDAAYIQYAKKLGIVSGDAGATTFRPHDPINRAETAKIANQIIEILLGGLTQ